MTTPESRDFYLEQWPAGAHRESEITEPPCRECRAGLIQALALEPAWNCPAHGVQRLSAHSIVTADSIAALNREDVEAAIDALHGVMQSLTDVNSRTGEAKYMALTRVTVALTEHLIERED